MTVLMPIDTNDANRVGGSTGKDTRGRPQCNLVVMIGGVRLE